MIPAIHAPGNGPHLERPASLRDVAARRDLPPPRRWPRPASCPPKPRATSGRRGALRHRAHRGDRAGRLSTTSSRSPRRSPSTSVPPRAGCTSGMTSSDVIDTAQALQMREACDLILQQSRGQLAEAIRDRALEHRRTPMIGRTHGVHAEPMTFGLKLALWYAEIGRDIERVQRARDVVSVGKLSGRRRHVRAPAAVDRGRCLPAPRPRRRRRSRRRSFSAIATPSCSSSLAITAASLEKFALEIRGLQKTEIGEVEEPFAQGPEGLVGDAAQAQPDRLRADRRSGAPAARERHAALENVALWHERDISHSSVERVILPDSFIALDHMLRRFTRDRDRAWSSTRSGCARISSDRAGWCSRATVLLELAGRASRASRPTSGCSATRCGRSRSSGTSRRSCVADPDVTRVLDRGGDRARVRSRRAVPARRSRLRPGLSADGRHVEE